MVICATSSNVPVFDGRWLEPGQHLVTIVGSNSALVTGGWLKEGRRENDDETVRRADFIVTNWRESIEQERQAGIFDPIARGIITWDKIHELGEVLDGTFAGRTSDDQITFHANNNGTAAAAHCGISALMTAANSAGELPMVSRPRMSRFRRTSGSAKTRRVSR